MTWQVITPLVTSYLVLVGLMMGSFINLAADRIPRGESIIWPRSHCRSCNRQLDIIDLLPVLGYLLRRGRCATCRTQIGAEAPVVEASCGLSMAASIALLGLWSGSLAGLALICTLGCVLIWLAFRRREAQRITAGDSPRLESNGSTSFREMPAVRQKGL